MSLTVGKVQPMPSVKPAPTTLRTWGVSELGRVRQNNQDSGYFDDRVAMVADGVGGSAAGDVASATIIFQLAKSLNRLADEIYTRPAELAAEINAAIGQANRSLRAIAAAEPELAGMATTLSGLAVIPGGAMIFHIGDSRIYLLRDENFQQLTHDQTWVQMLLDQGHLDADGALNHPLRNMLLHCLTGAATEIDQISWQAINVKDGDRFALVSDGLSTYLPEDAFIQILRENQQPADAAGALVSAAVPTSRDNVTVIVADVVAAEHRHGFGTLIGAADTAGHGQPQAHSA